MIVPYKVNYFVASFTLKSVSLSVNVAVAVSFVERYVYVREEKCCNLIYTACMDAQV